MLMTTVVDCIIGAQYFQSIEQFDKAFPRPDSLLYENYPDLFSRNDSTRCDQRAHLWQLNNVPLTVFLLIKLSYLYIILISVC